MNEEKTDMKWKIIAAFFLLVLGIAIFIFGNEFRSSNESKEILPLADDKINIFIDKEYDDMIEDIDIDSKSYSTGFEKGMHSFLLQIGSNRPCSANYSTPQTQQEFAVLIERYDDKQKERCEELWWKGYVDGYHKATATEFCPGENK